MRHVGILTPGVAPKLVTANVPDELQRLEGNVIGSFMLMPSGMYFKNSVRFLQRSTSSLISHTVTCTKVFHLAKLRLDRCLKPSATNLNKRNKLCCNQSEYLPKY